MTYPKKLSDEQVRLIEKTGRAVQEDVLSLASEVRNWREGESLAIQELKNIRDARPWIHPEWNDDFRAWAQSRARFTLQKMGLD